MSVKMKAHYRILADTNICHGTGKDGSHHAQVQYAAMGSEAQPPSIKINVTRDCATEEPSS